MKTIAKGKTYKTKLGEVTVHIGRVFQMVCFPPVKWYRKSIPAEWRN